MHCESALEGTCRENWSFPGWTPARKGQLGLLGTPFSLPQREAIGQLAGTYGYEVLELEVGVRYPQDVLRDCEVLCGYFPKALLRGAARLRWLQLPSAGADKYVDEAIYPHPGVILTNASGAFGAAIAEQLLMGALMLLRRMPEYQAQQQEKRWHRVGPLRFLRGSRVAILGTGNLGGTFGTYCQALGAHVVGVSRSGSPKEGFDRVYPMGDLLEAVRGADLVAACLPLTQETQGCIDRAVFQAMGPESIFLSVGRGKTVVQADLVEALETGTIYGAMLDVAEQEPMPEDCPLWTMDRVIITPHISGSDLDEANSQEIFSIFMDNLSRFFAGLPLHHIVDRQKGY